jgi:hypothetical protein
MYFTALHVSVLGPSSDILGYIYIYTCIDRAYRHSIDIDRQYIYIYIYTYTYPHSQTRSVSRRALKL